MVQFLQTPCDPSMLEQAVRDNVLIEQRPEATNKILVGLSPRRPLEIWTVFRLWFVGQWACWQAFLL